MSEGGSYFAATKKWAAVAMPSTHVSAFFQFYFSLVPPFTSGEASRSISGQSSLSKKHNIGFFHFCARTIKLEVEWIFLAILYRDFTD